MQNLVYLPGRFFFRRRGKLLMSESCRIELQEFSRIQRVIGRQYGVLVCNILPGPIVDLSMSIFSGDQYHNRDGNLGFCIMAGHGLARALERLWPKRVHSVTWVLINYVGEFDMLNKGS